MNNQIFDITRFAKVFVREFNRYKFKLLAVLAVFFGLFVLSIVYSYGLHTAPLEISYKGIGIILIIIAPIIFSRDINRISAIFDFTLPASSFEKFMVKWSLSVILMPLLIFVFLLLIAGLYLVMPGGLCVDAGNHILKFLAQLSFEKVMFFSALQSFFLVGVYYFRKHAFLKVCLSLVVYFLLFAFIFILTHKYMFNGAYEMSWNFNISNEDFGIQQNNSLGESNTIVYVILNVIAPLGLWVVSFFKSREMEI